MLEEAEIFRDENIYRVKEDKEEKRGNRKGSRWRIEIVKEKLM